MRLMSRGGEEEKGVKGVRSVGEKKMGVDTV